MATRKQRAAIKELSENIGTPIGTVMRKVGYSLATSKSPSLLTKSKGWNELLSEIEDEPLLSRLRTIALDTEDKRAALTSIDMIMKLKDRYPAGKLKVLSAIESRNRVYVEQESDPAP